MTNNKLNSIGTQSIPRLILAFSVPAIVSMAVESLYNVIDRYFVAAGVGYLGIAGITLCFPIMLFIMALSMIVGVGGNTLFAIRLGQKKYGQAALCSAKFLWSLCSKFLVRAKKLFPMQRITCESF